jgi:hypothetical protein
MEMASLGSFLLIGGHGLTNFYDLSSKRAVDLTITHKFSGEMGVLA